MKRFLEFLLERTPRLNSAPTVYGAFHTESLCIFLLIAVLMVVFRKRLPKGERALRIGLVVFGVGLLLLEIGKQIVYSYTPGQGWSYNWSRFPFQFCSSPIYAAVTAMCLRDGKIRRTLLCFLATYSPVAGCAVLFWPSADVFSTILYIDLHTMLWHGSMFLFGLYLWLSEAVLPEWKTALRAFCVFLPLNLIALGLNELEHTYGFAGEYVFNMFYTSRYYRCSIPLLSTVQKSAPYAVFFISYIVLLGTGGLLVTVGMMLVRRMEERRNNNNNT